ncbi:OmpA family protein [Rhodanobacter sp. C03]|uniref:OmpA family protein n=1 Tax=Rhodanobacter sp. C03 TaxID=1945858 RepID=UPI001C2C37DD|nr:OmpA family protein [Rhodanobacter sp. C03]
MNAIRPLSCLAAALLLVATCAVAQDAGSAPPSSNASDTPSVKSIVDQLKVKDDDSVNTGATRSLRLGGAEAAGKVADEPVAPPPPASISMQIQFAFNSDRIEGASATTMSNLATALGSDELKGRTFQVIGHTDGVGSAGYNMHLSQMRAASVKRFLTEHGVAADRLSASGKGASELLNKADPTAAENRRVEIVASGG